MKILVTGASGFVGGNTVAALRARPATRCSASAAGSWPTRSTVRSTSASAFDLDFAPDAVLHAAAKASPWGARREFERDNVAATANVIAFCERTAEKLGRRPRLVYVSSSSVFYQPGDQLGMTEAWPIGPRFANDYAATKAAGEKLVEQYPGLVGDRPAAGGLRPGRHRAFPAHPRSRPERQAAAPGAPRRARPGRPRLHRHPHRLPAPAARTGRAARRLQPHQQPAGGDPAIPARDLRPPGHRPADQTRTAAGRLHGRRRHRNALPDPRSRRASRRSPASESGSSPGPRPSTSQKTLRDLGPPKVSIAEGVEAFVAWQKEQESHERLRDRRRELRRALSRLGHRQGAPGRALQEPLSAGPAQPRRKAWPSPRRSFPAIRCSRSGSARRSPRSSTKPTSSGWSTRTTRRPGRSAGGSPQSSPANIEVLGNRAGAVRRQPQAVEARKGQGSL